MKQSQIILLALATVIVAFFVFRKKKLPVQGKITSKFGNRRHPISGNHAFHNGVDIAAPTGTPVKSPAFARVEKVYYNSTGGNQVIIKQFLSDTTLGFAHLSKTLVEVGDIVYPGTEIALVGNTGQSTGAHLHFTVRKNGELIDPLSVFKN